MAGMAQYGDTRTLGDTEKPLFVAAAQSAIKVRLCSGKPVRRQSS
jgi:hypothetical protein